MSPSRSTQEREDEAFAAWMTELFDDVWRFVRRRTANASDADDVTSQVFGTAWRRRDDMPDGDEARPWAFGIARWTLSNHHRSHRRQANLRLRLIERTDPAQFDPAISHEFLEAIDALSLDDREVLIMRAWDGLAVNEMATVLNCTPNAASIRLHRARRRLQAVLSDPADPRPVTTDPHHGGDQR